MESNKGGSLPLTTETMLICLQMKNEEMDKLLRRKKEVCVSAIGQIQSDQDICERAFWHYVQRCSHSSGFTRCELLED